MPSRFAGGYNERRERITRAIRDGRAGRNATTVALERHLIERARKPGAFVAMVAKRRRDRAAEARVRGDAAFGRAVGERALWQAAIASCGGIIADETMVDGRAVRDPGFDVVRRRYRSTLRAAWMVKCATHLGNIADIIVSLAAAGIVTNCEGVLAWCAADTIPSRAAYRRIARVEVEAESELQVRELLRSRFIRIVEPTKTQRKATKQKQKRKATSKRRFRGDCMLANVAAVPDLP